MLVLGRSGRSGAELEGVEGVAEVLEGFATVVVVGGGAFGGCLLLFGFWGTSDAGFAEGGFEALELGGRHGDMGEQKRERKAEFRSGEVELFGKFRVWTWGRFTLSFHRFGTGR